MLVLNPALERPHDPSLEQRGDLVDARHDDVGRIGAAADDGDLVAVAGVLEPAVARPSWTTLPGSTALRTKDIRLSAETSPTSRRRTRPKPSFSTAIATMALRSVWPRPPRGHRCRFRRLPPRRTGGRAQAGPWRAATCAATSRPCDSFRSPAPAGAPAP